MTRRNFKGKIGGDEKQAETFFAKVIATNNVHLVNDLMYFVVDI